MITGLSHVSIAVPSLDAAAKRLKELYGLEIGPVKVNEQQGVRMAYVELPNARIVHGERIAFVHPKDFLGALVELEESKAKGERRKTKGKS